MEEKLKIPEVVAAQLAMEYLGGLLRKGEDDDRPNFLESSLESMNDWWEMKRTLETVADFCGPKALGECCPKGYDDRVWNKLLDSLEDSCIRAWNALERLPAEMRKRV